MKEKEQPIQFEPEIFKNHHDKNIIEYNGCSKRGGVNYFSQLSSDISSSGRSKSSERSRCDRHHPKYRNYNNNISRYISSDRHSSKTSSSHNDDANSYRSSLLPTPDEEEKEREFLEKNMGIFSISKDGKKQQPVVVYVGDGRSRVRRVVGTQTRHVTVVSYSTRHKQTRTSTSHHVTTVR